MLCGPIVTRLKTKWKQLLFMLWLRQSMWFYCSHICFFCEHWDKCGRPFVEDEE